MSSCAVVTIPGGVLTSLIPSTASVTSTITDPATTLTTSSAVVTTVCPTSYTCPGNATSCETPCATSTSFDAYTTTLPGDVRPTVIVSTATITSLVTADPTTSTSCTSIVTTPTSSPTSRMETSTTSAPVVVPPTLTVSSEEGASTVTSYSTLIITTMDPAGRITTSTSALAIPTVIHRNGSSSKGASTGAIAGGVVGGVAFILLALGFLWYLKKKGVFSRDKDEGFDEDMWRPDAQNRMSAAYGATAGGAGGAMVAAHGVRDDDDDHSYNEEGKQTGRDDGEKSSGGHGSGSGSGHGGPQAWTMNPAMQQQMYYGPTGGAEMYSDGMGGGMSSEGAPGSPGRYSAYYSPQQGPLSSDGGHASVLSMPAAAMGMGSPSSMPYGPLPGEGQTVYRRKSMGGRINSQYDPSNGPVYYNQAADRSSHRLSQGATPLFARPPSSGNLYRDYPTGATPPASHTPINRAPTPKDFGFPDSEGRQEELSAGGRSQDGHMSIASDHSDSRMTAATTGSTNGYLTRNHSANALYHQGGMPHRSNSNRRSFGSSSQLYPMSQVINMGNNGSTGVSQRPSLEALHARQSSGTSSGVNSSRYGGFDTTSSASTALTPPFPSASLSKQASATSLQQQHSPTSPTGSLPPYSYPTARPRMESRESYDSGVEEPSQFLGARIANATPHEEQDSIDWTPSPVEMEMRHPELMDAPDSKEIMSPDLDSTVEGTPASFATASPTSNADSPVVLAAA